MLEKHGTTFVATCDFCPYYVDTEEDEFLAAVEKIKSEGFKVYKTGHEWNHKCGGCCEEEAGEDFGDVS